MSRNNYAERMSNESTEELLNLVIQTIKQKKGIQVSTSLSTESFEAAKNELSERNLTEEEKKLLIEWENYQPKGDTALSAEEKIETGITQDIQKLKSDAVNRKYPALRFISDLYKILAWIIVVATAIVFFFGLSQEKLGILVAIGSIVIGGILVVTLLAIAEGIKLFIDIEHNTRLTAMNSNK